MYQWKKNVSFPPKWDMYSKSSNLKSDIRNNEYLLQALLKIKFNENI